MHIDTMVISILSIALVIIALLYWKLLRTKDALAESHTKHRAIFDTTMEAIVLYDENHNVIELNQTAGKMFGYTLQEPVGRHILEFIDPDTRQITVEYIQSQAEGTYETRGLRKDGSTFPVLASGKFLTINGKSVRVSVLIDLTALKQAQYKLENLNLSLENRVAEELEKNRLKEEKLFQQSRLAQMGEMISMIAHQWRQPLSAISSTVTNIESKMAMDKYDLKTETGSADCKLFLEKKLHHIDDYVQGLSRTIDDFRNFYNPNKTKQSVDITEPINQACNLMISSFIKHHVKINKNFQTDEKILMHDSEFMQVILNILKNALDQLVEKEIENPSIMIETLKNDTHIIIQISDNAGGIADEHFITLFDPYFSTKNEKNGTGLGLYMSKTIIEEHHEGMFYAKNNADGATFTIELKY